MSHAPRLAAAPAAPKAAPLHKPAVASHPVAKPTSNASSKSSLHNHSVSSNGNNSTAINVELQQENLRLLTESNEIKASLDGLEKERDFYFGKLRDIEVLCQEYESENLPVVKKILDILYETADGFIAPAEDLVDTNGVELLNGEDHHQNGSELGVNDEEEF